MQLTRRNCLIFVLFAFKDIRCIKIGSCLVKEPLFTVKLVYAILNLWPIWLWSKINEFQAKSFFYSYFVWKETAGIMHALIQVQLHGHSNSRIFLMFGRTLKNFCVQIFAILSRILLCTISILDHKLNKVALIIFLMY